MSRSRARRQAHTRPDTGEDFSDILGEESGSAEAQSGEGQEPESASSGEGQEPETRPAEAPARSARDAATQRVRQAKARVAKAERELDAAKRELRAAEGARARSTRQASLVECNQAQRRATMDPGEPLTADEAGVGQARNPHPPLFEA